MKVAVASLGTVPEALVGIRFGTCSQFLVFDLDTMVYVVVSVTPHQQPEEHVSLEAIRAVARQDVSAVITGAIKDACRRTLEELGIDVIAGVQGHDGDRGDRALQGHPPGGTRIAPGRDDEDRRGLARRGNGRPPGNGVRRLRVVHDREPADEGMGSGPGGAPQHRRTR